MSCGRLRRRFPEPLVEHLGGARAEPGRRAGHAIPGTDIVVSNVLSEDDLNPREFHRWTLDERMTSMMAPTVLGWPDGRRAATGSGSSNRVRTALLQVFVNLVDFAMSVEEVVVAPRIPVEESFLSVEGGFDIERIDSVLEAWRDHQLRDRSSMFLGGAHAAVLGGQGVQGSGDPGRDGECEIVCK